MKRTSALSGVIGLVLLLFGILATVLTTGHVARLFAGVNLLAGAIAIIGWLASSRASIGALAGSRATKYGANAALYVVAFVGILVAINFLGIKYHRQFDMTSNGVYSLSPQSIAVAKGLKQPLKFYGFAEAGRNPALAALYQEYSYASPEVSYEMVDPNRHPELAEKYKVSVMNTTHIQYGGEAGSGTNVTDTTEAALTNGIIKVTRASTKTVYFLTGEGEADPNGADQEAGSFSQFKTALEGENYAVKTINLATEPQVPADCSLLVIAGPTRPLLPHIVDAVNEYLDHGGRAIVMMRPHRPDQSIDESALIKLVADWGVKIGDNIVVDQVVRLFAGPSLGLNPLVNTYGPHPITTSFDKQTVFPMVRTVDPVDPTTPGLQATVLATTSATSWAETDLNSIFKRQQASFHPGDLKGPVNVAAAVEGNLGVLKRGDGQARLVIFGDTDFANNQFIDNFFNRDFLMNSVDWLTGETSSISIRPRTLRASRFNLTIGEFDVVFVLSVLLLPELLLIIGIAVWFERRN